jgi:hypothetical protein
MKRVVRHTLAIVALAVAGTSVSHAASDEMLDKCIEHFVSSQFAGFDGKITINKEADAGYHKPLMLRSNRIELIAVHRATGAKLATGTCRSGRDGLVVSIKAHAPTPSKIAKSDKPTEVVLGDAG